MADPSFKVIEPYIHSGEPFIDTVKLTLGHCGKVTYLLFYFTLDTIKSFVDVFSEFFKILRFLLWHSFYK